MISIQKLRDMNLNSVADELESLRAFKTEVENQVPVGLVKTIGGYPDESEHGVDWLVKHHQLVDGQDLYTKPVPADKSTRITEKDIQEIANHIFGYISVLYPESAFENWFSKFGGRELLSKLNADRQVLDDGSAQKLWDYYQTLLKHYGFEGITDLLSKYRKLVEQVSVVTMPDVATPEMEAAAEKYWNERRLKGLSDDPRTWAGVYATMRAAAPSQNQHNSNDEGFKLIPNPPCGFNLIAYNRHTEEWLYINHANTWQLFQGPNQGIKRLTKVEEWRESLMEMVQAMRSYEMDVDEPAPHKHRAMMDRAEALLAAAPPYSQQSAKSGYAGVTVWVGDKTITQIVSRLEIETSSADELLRRFENARHLLSQSERCPSHESEQLAGLVGALEEAYGTLERAVSPADEMPEAAIQSAMFVIEAALAAYRKQGE